MDSYEPPCCYEKLILGLLSEYQVVLLTTEPSLQTLIYLLKQILRAECGGKQL